MKSFLKFIFAAIGALVALVIILIVGVFLFFDPNDYREQISQQLTEASGREVRIEGELGLSVFPWLAVDAGRITMAAAPAFGPEPMLTLEGASAGVRLLPLFRGSVQIGTVTLSGLDLRLAVRGDGMTSWQDLLERADASSAQGDAAPREGGGDASDISIEGIVIADASVTYTDRAAGSEYQLSDFSMQIDAVDLEAPIPFEAGFDYSLQPAEVDGAMTLAGVARLSQEDAGALLMLRDLSLRGDVMATSLASRQAYSLRTDLLSLDFGNNSMNLEPARIAFGPLNGELSLSGSGPADPLALSGSLELDRFKPAELFAALAMEPPETTDGDALASVQLNTQLGLTFESVTLNDLELRVDETTLAGQLSVENFARPTFGFELAGDEINLDRYLPPATDESAVSADGGDNLAETALPVDLIRGLNANGRLRFKRLTLGELPFENLDLGLKVAESQARLQPISATVLDGTYNGDVRIDASRKVPSLSLNETVAGLNIGKLAALLWERDNVEGTLGGNFALRGNGAMLSEIRSTLAGNVSFELTDGALAGTDLWYQIRRARALFKQQTPPPAPSPARTEFSTLRGSAVVADGIARNDDLFAELPFLQLTGKGTVNLADATVDYGLRARVLERPEFLSNATPAELDEYTEAVIPLRISGELAAPTILPDIEGMAREAVKQKVESEKDRLKQRLLDKLGGEGEEEEAPADLEEEAKKKLRDLLRR